MPPSRPWQRLRFLTSWFAQAEHGGFYQAQATGLYARAGLDVAIDMGGPQVNGMQLLSAGAADIIMGYDIQVLKAVEQGLPVVTIAACFSKGSARADDPCRYHRSNPAARSQGAAGHALARHLLAMAATALRISR
jgi:ABC-type nitrate/sulfonate/bicarbonate transport system substrate-binding protein